MKKIFTQLTMLVLGINLIYSQTSVPNGDFELWGISEYGYEFPMGWSDPLGDFFCPDSSYNLRTEDSYSGNWAVRLESFGDTSISEDSSQVECFRSGFIASTENFLYSMPGGFVIHERPSKLRGHYKYFPNGDDNGTILIYFFKNSTNIDNIIGYGELFLFETVTVYDGFDITIEYFSDEMPDTAVIMMGSGDNNGGSTLIVDDLSFDYNTTSIKDDEKQNKALILFPNPVKDILTVDTYFKNTDFRISDLQNRPILVGTLSEETEIDCSSLKTGVYLFQCTDGKSSYSEKFIKL